MTKIRFSPQKYVGIFLERTKGDRNMNFEEVVPFNNIYELTSEFFRFGHLFSSCQRHQYLSIGVLITLEMRLKVPILPEFYNLRKLLSCMFLHKPLS